MTQRHKEYKPSGVKWIGEIPAHWEVRPGFTCFEENKDRNKKLIEKTVLSLSYGRIIVKPEEKMTGLVPESFETYQLIKPGDIVIRTTDLQNDKTSLRVGLAKDKGMITSAYLGLRCKTEINPEYVFRLLESYDAMKVFYGMGSGLRQNIDFWDFKRLPVPTPPYAEQTRIVKFLDIKTAEFDAAIEKKLKLIDLLLMQKDVLTNAAVSHGIRPEVPKVFSGLDWIGDIPENWEMVPLTKYARSVVDYRGKTPEKVADGVFLVTAKNIKRGKIDYLISEEFISPKDYPKVMARGLPELGDLIFTTEAPLGEVALVDRTDVAFAQRIIKLRLRKDRLNPRFVIYAMQSQYFQSLLAREATGSTAQGIKASKLHKLKIAAPIVNEQIDIANYLDHVTSNIDSLVSHQRIEINKFRELRASLISETVLGQIKV
ncbi:restriction endonuclease subunit S [Caenimonas koreensis DSM 17982]|uniref:Restriction endonuclease subunit S n=1 Tax=Caenimonas koreensis DSM 17982 TaxID=1121255 RepID=A0A844B4S2_9BURK|nr:restriction endonuclease subunit S [Caenimonas koreensis]MRD46527.1 restriction endonuclease subunit S [Caenimonas koreensis DSM 17982]